MAVSVNNAILVPVSATRTPSAPLSTCRAIASQVVYCRRHGSVRFWLFALPTATKSVAKASRDSGKTPWRTCLGPRLAWVPQELGHSLLLHVGSNFCFTKGSIAVLLLLALLLESFRLYIVDGTDVHITRDDGQTAIIQLKESNDKATSPTHGPSSWLL